MQSINVTTVRKNIYTLINQVNNSHSPITITYSRGKNAVLIGEDDWVSIQETLHLMKEVSVPQGGESCTN